MVGTEAELTLDQVDRQVGADSFETAALVVRYAVTQGLTFTHSAIVTGASFPDGVVTGSYLALDRGILILIKEGEQPGSPLSVLTANLDEVRVLDFIALPQLAKQMAAGRAAGSSGATGTRPADSGARPDLRAPRHDKHHDRTECRWLVEADT